VCVRACVWLCHGHFLTFVHVRTLFFLRSVDGIRAIVSESTELETHAHMDTLAKTKKIKRTPDISDCNFRNPFLHLV